MTALKPSERMGSLYFRLVVYALLTAGCMYMIYRFSSQDGGTSSELSETVAKAIAAALYVGFDTFGQVEKLEILQGISFNVRKAAHMAEFAVLGGLSTATMWQLVQLVGKERCSVILSAILGFVVTTAYAFSDEYHQLFVDGRAGQLRDVAIDAAGAAIGIVLVAVFIGMTTIAWRRRLASRG